MPPNDTTSQPFSETNLNLRQNEFGVWTDGHENDMPNQLKTATGRQDATEQNDQALAKGYITQKQHDRQQRLITAAGDTTQNQAYNEYSWQKEKGAQLAEDRQERDHVRSAQGDTNNKQDSKSGANAQDSTNNDIPISEGVSLRRHKNDHGVDLVISHNGHETIKGSYKGWHMAKDPSGQSVYVLEDPEHNRFGRTEVSVNPNGTTDVREFSQRNNGLEPMTSSTTYDKTGAPIAGDVLNHNDADQVAANSQQNVVAPTAPSAATNRGAGRPPYVGSLNADAARVATQGDTHRNFQEALKAKTSEGEQLRRDVADMEKPGNHATKKQIERVQKAARNAGHDAIGEPDGIQGPKTAQAMQDLTGKKFEDKTAHSTNPHRASVQRHHSHNAFT